MSSINGSHGTVTKADLYRGCYCQYNVRAQYNVHARPSATGSHKLTCIPTTKCMYRWPSLLGASKLGCTKTHLGTCDATAAVLAGGGEDDINHELHVQGNRRRATWRPRAGSIPSSPPGLQRVNRSWEGGRWK